MNISAPKKANLSLVFFISTVLLSVSHSSPTQAASDAECGIWMCLPTGFGQGCSESKSAFKKRIKRHKSALPSFSSCLSKSDSNETTDNFESKTGFAAQIGSYKECVKTERVFGGGRDGDKTKCVEWKTYPAYIIKDTHCSIRREKGSYGLTRTPANCTETLRYTEVYRNGQRFGNTHYY
ncbi:hypothetical protein AB4480_08100 [Vibrio sp. 10N.261.45.A4]|uniref:hypothetical protein n=1 Tax=Vibrio sp. 10N.261.45.A4 TaxID=3229655 RepID=UPI003551AE2C